MAAAKNVDGSELASRINTCLEVESFSSNDSTALEISATRVSLLFMGLQSLSAHECRFTAKCWAARSPWPDLALVFFLARPAVPPSLSLTRGASFQGMPFSWPGPAVAWHRIGVE